MQCSGLYALDRRPSRRDPERDVKRSACRIDMGSGRIVDLVFSALVAKQPCVFYGAFSRIDDMRGE